MTKTRISNATLRVLGKSEVERLLPMRDCVDALDAAFRAGGQSRVQSFVGGAAGADGKFHVKAALADGTRPLFAAKINANFPGNPTRHGLPTIQGVLVLFDASNGRQLAIMDSGAITVIRTAAASAVAAKYLARVDADTLTVIGCGAQALAHVRAMQVIRPIKRVTAFDQNRDAARALARSARDVDIAVADDLLAATRSADIVATCTSSRSAFLGSAHVKRGTFVAAVGADAPDKQELDPELLRFARVYVDDLDQCAAMGDLHHAIKAGLDPSHVRGTLADVAANPTRHGWDPERVTVFDSTGIPVEDVVAAQLVFERAEKENVGKAIELS
jgi:alanine dehydrogenase